MTMSPADSRPSAVSPTGPPNQWPKGTTIVPGVTRFSVAGSTTIPVKTGTKSHTRATKNLMREAARRRNREGDDVHRCQRGDRVQERGHDQETEQREHLHPGVEPLQQARRRGDVVGEHRAADEPGHPTEGLLHEPTASPPSDAATRTQSDLAPQQPVGREAPRGPGRRDVGGAHHTPAVSRSTWASVRSRPPRRRRGRAATRNTVNTTPTMRTVPTMADA